MKTQVSGNVVSDQSTSDLNTTFITKKQTASLMHVLDLTREEIEQVSGGLRVDCIILDPDCIVLA